MQRFWHHHLHAYKKTRSLLPQSSHQSGQRQRQRLTARLSLQDPLFKPFSVRARKTLHHHFHLQLSTSRLRGFPTRLFARAFHRRKKRRDLQSWRRRGWKRRQSSPNCGHRQPEEILLDHRIIWCQSQSVFQVGDRRTAIPRPCWWRRRRLSGRQNWYAGQQASRCKL